MSAISHGHRRLEVEVSVPQPMNARPRPDGDTLIQWNFINFLNKKNWSILIGFKTKRFCFKICWQNKVVCVACNEWPSFGFLLLARGIGGIFRGVSWWNLFKKLFYFLRELVWYFLLHYLFIAVHFWSVCTCALAHNAARVSKLLLWLINEHISVLLWPVLRIYIEMNFSCVGLCVCPLFFFSFLAF